MGNARHAHFPTGAQAVVLRAVLAGELRLSFLSRRETMNQIIWVVGLVVIVLFIAGYFGLR